MRYSASRSGAALLLALPLLAGAVPLSGMNIPIPAGTTIPLNRRASFLLDDGSVNIPALARHLNFAAAKFQRGFAAFERNTGAAHPLAFLEDLLGLARRGAGGVALADQGEMLWTGTIALGTPPQAFTMDFDTGSSDLFVPAAGCGGSAGCDGRAEYDARKSTSGRELGRNFTLRYGDGSTVKGKQYAESVTIAGLSAANQTIGAADTYSAGFTSGMDGLVGLGFNSISVYNAPPLLDTLVAQGAVDAPVFGFKLAQGGSELFIGGTNKTLYAGEPTYVDVTHEGYWQVEMDQLAVNGTQAVGKTAAIIDSGTTLLVGNEQDVANFYKNVTGAKPVDGQQGLWSVPCDAVPQVSLTFGGKKVDIRPETFTLGPVSMGSSDCLAGVASTTSMSFWIIGDVFMQNVYTIFDKGASRVGFADLA